MATANNPTSQTRDAQVHGGGGVVTPLHRNNLEQIREGLGLILEPGSVAELRIVKTRQGTVAGYFNDPVTMAELAAEWSGKAPGVYLTLNPADPRLLARSANKLTPYARVTTSDSDILRRRWFPVDLDPVRPAGISATDDEHKFALDRALEVREWLTKEGYPNPVYADSGNGAHLLYRIDVPNDDLCKKMLQRCLLALSLKFSDTRVAVDITTFNASRIWKVYGTLACKGDNQPDRPHRLSRLLEVS